MKIKNKRQSKNTNAAVSFHKTWLGRIRKELGSKCSYISHVSKKGEYYLKVVIKNTSGGNDTITYKLQGAPDTLTSNDYQALLTMLKKGEYEQGSKKSLPEPSKE